MWKARFYETNSPIEGGVDFARGGGRKCGERADEGGGVLDWVLYVSWDASDRDGWSFASTPYLFSNNE